MTNSANGPSLLLGSVEEGWSKRAFHLGPAEVATHKHVIGITGQGKSRLLQAMFVQLLHQGVGASMIDPHRDLARDTLRYLIQQGFFDRPEAYRRLIYIDFALDRYVPFNVLNTRGSPHDIAYFFLEAIKRAWPALSRGAAPNLENIILASTEILVEAGLPITRMPDLLADKAFRDEILASVRDEEVKRFFRLRFDQLGRSANQLSESTLRRIFLLTFAPVLRYTLGQTDNLLDFRRFMDENVSVIYDLGGVQNPDVRRLLGCLITVGYELAAMSRVDLPSGFSQRRQHQLILDEFAEYVAQSEEALTRILALCRKYGLYLTLAHQTWSQTSQRLRGALQNAGVEIAFRLGRADAELTSRSIGSVEAGQAAMRGQWETWTQAIQNLAPREAFVQTPSVPTTSVRTLNVWDSHANETDLRQVLDTYARMYHRPVTANEASPGSSRSSEEPRFRKLWA